MAIARKALTLVLAGGLLALLPLVRRPRRKTRRCRRRTSGRLPVRSANTTAASCSAASRSIARSARSVTASRWSSFRTLAEPGGPGFSTAQAAAIAAEYQVPAEPDDQGEVKDRPGRLADHFPAPFKNDNEARARYNAVPPDLSVIAKARGYERGFPWWVLDMFTQYQEQGVDYLTALLQGYEDKPPAGFTLPPATSTTSIFPATPSRCRRR